ncbi:hypothetical protein LXL04_006737 [Taraxacum kok-saghyz]
MPILFQQQFASQYQSHAPLEELKSDTEYLTIYIGFYCPHELCARPDSGVCGILCGDAPVECALRVTHRWRVQVFPVWIPPVLLALLRRSNPGRGWLRPRGFPLRLLPSKKKKKKKNKDHLYNLKFFNYIYDLIVVALWKSEPKSATAQQITQAQLPDPVHCYSTRSLICCYSNRPATVPVPSR